MDIKLTKKRLNNHLSYDWWKYIAILVACIFLWSLLFTMTAPRLHNAKKMEIFFIVNGFSVENSDKLRNGLKEYLSDEFVEIHFNNYTPNDSTTAQVLSARVGVKEGDIYVFPYSQDLNGDVFGSYVDNSLFADFETIIAGAKEFSDITLEEFTEKYGKRKEYNTEETLQKAFDECKRASVEAVLLEGYINQYKDYVNEVDTSMYPEDTNNSLFYKYSRFTIHNTLFPEDIIEGQQEKIWGLNFNPLCAKVSDFNDKGFMFLNTSDSTTGKKQPLNYVMGIVSFKEDNLPLYYENIAVINYFIQNYYLNQN